MAPSAIYASEQPPLLLADGAALEVISDAVDKVNKLKGLSSPITAYDSESKFDSAKDKASFRQYETACERVRAFYSEQHARQTVEHNLRMRAHFFDPKRKREEMTIWQAMERLNTLIDDSDPDTDLSQIQHLLQSAEAIRRDGKPRWMQVTGLVHDLGKLMLFFKGCSTGQWDVVGDTFPVGCKWDEKCVFAEAFGQNPDREHPIYGTKNGIYTPGKGIDQFMMSWGHDEFLYLVLKDQSVLPREALAMIRYHSFYPWHHEGAYKEFMTDGDEVLLRAVQAFNPYDLYSKTDEEPDVEKMKVWFPRVSQPEGKLLTKYGT